MWRVLWLEFFRAFICAKYSSATKKNSKRKLRTMWTVHFTTQYLWIKAHHTTYHSSDSTIIHYSTAWSIFLGCFNRRHQIFSYSASRAYWTIWFSPYLWGALVFESWDMSIPVPNMFGPHIILFDIILVLCISKFCFFLIKKTEIMTFSGKKKQRFCIFFRKKTYPPR